MRSLLMTLILTAFYTITQASEEPSAIIKGKVTTADGQPAAFVSVQIKNTNKGTITDQTGAFVFRKLQPGHYTLQVSLIGYETLEQEVDLTTDAAVTVVLQLTLSGKELQGVTVSSNRNKFASKATDQVARMPLINLENPQVYTIIDDQLMKEQVTVDYRQALWNAPGVVPGTNPAGGVTAMIRGFNVNTSVRNGLAAQSWAFVDPVNIERAEVIKGPSGTLFGSGIVSFGGLINQVTKKPFDTFKGEVSATLGSYDLSRITADINTPVTEDRSMLLRINSAYHNEGSFQNTGHNRSFTLAPSFLYKIDDRLTLSIDAEIFSQNKTQNPYPTFSPGIISSLSDVALDYKTGYGGENIDAKVSSRNVYIQANYMLSNQWTSTTNLAYSNNHVERSLQLYPLYASPIKVTRRVTDFGPRDFNGIDFQQNFTGDFTIGQFRNRVLMGFDIFTYHGKQKYSNQITYDIIEDITNPFPVMALEKLNTLAAAVPYSWVDTKQNIYSAYVSDVFNITDRFNVMASVRVDRFNNKPTITNGVSSPGYDQTAWSPKFGAVYQLIRNRLSVFGNYMNGFSNVGPVSQPDGEVAVFKPRQANQAEGGIKADLFHNKLTATVSYYNIKISNATRTDANGFTIQDGTQRSEGFEVECIANPLKGLNIVAGYGNNENRYLQSADALKGKYVQTAPRHAVNGWLSYKFSQIIKNAGIGFGGNYVSESFFDAANTIAIPAYTLLNAAIFYDHPKWMLSLKVNNISSEQYWNASAAYQMPRQFLGSMTFKF